MASVNNLPPSPFLFAVHHTAEALPVDVSGREHPSTGSVNYPERR